MRLSARFVAENLRLGASRRPFRGDSPRALEPWSMTVRMARVVRHGRRCGIGAQHTRAREPFEPLMDGAQVLVRARRTEAPAELVEVGGDDGGRRGGEG